MVNDDVKPTNISALNSRAGFHKTVPVEIHLEKGSENVVKFGVEGAGKFLIPKTIEVRTWNNANVHELGFEATVDGIEVFVDEEEL